MSSKNKNSSGKKSGSREEVKLPKNIIYHANVPQLLSVTDRDDDDNLDNFYKQLDGSPDFTFKKEVVTYKMTTRISAIAVKKGVTCYDDGFQIKRFASVDLFYLGKKYQYAIPLELLSIKPSFPALDFTPKEVEILYIIMEVLSKKKSYEEELEKVIRREQEDVIDNLKKAELLPRDEQLIVKLFNQYQWTLDLFLEGVLANLRPWIKKEILPIHLVKLAKKKEEKELATQMLRACNFTTGQLIELDAIVDKELNYWETLGCRLSLMTVGKKEYEELLKKAEMLNLHRILGIEESSFVSQPFLITDEKVESPVVHKIEIKDIKEGLTGEQLNAVRGFLRDLIGNVEETAIKASTLYEQKLQDPSCYSILNKV